jgi:hypothetical protein
LTFSLTPIYDFLTSQGDLPESNMKKWPVTLVVVVVSLLFSVAGQAVERDDEYRDHIKSKQSALLEARQKLDSVPSAEWTDPAIQQYLSEAIWVVYLGAIYYSYKNNRLPSDFTSLSNSEYVPTWPGNPFSNWEPMVVVERAGEFKAGAFSLQICPPEYYSRIKDSRPLSFELGIFGPNPEFATGQAEPLNLNSWAMIPEGTVYMLGTYTEPASSVKRKLEKIQSEQKGGVTK